MAFKQQLSSINYEPNRYEDTPKEDGAYTDPQTPIQGVTGRQKFEKTNNFGQAGRIYRSHSKEVQDTLVKNLINDLQAVGEQAQLLAICNFYRADDELGKRLAAGLNIDISPYLQHLTK
ncbi:catalase-related domain-containing protein [Halalkalibacter urbisdiaboli]|uniref:catalase-related domain-containing protein n=1 Tax=Halalkalibacter urbisdiaboli TaxID=1960589 RepID=UPI000B4371C4|nr:catalase-related domain-containing protein [Halalkalibacter urbisdiaboli]